MLFFSSRHCSSMLVVLEVSYIGDLVPLYDICFFHMTNKYDVLMIAITDDTMTLNGIRITTGCGLNCILLKISMLNSIDLKTIL